MNLNEFAVSSFYRWRRENIKEAQSDAVLRQQTQKLMMLSLERKSSYNWDWCGRPIIQYPDDLMALQEIIWRVKPDLIIETGVAHGGGLMFYASMLEIIGSVGEVVGVDVEIREHNRRQIDEHPLRWRIRLVESSSVSEEAVCAVKAYAHKRRRIMVCLDSLHTHDHVLKELELYSPLVTKGSYLIVFDTIIEECPRGFYSDRPWDVGNNPATAVEAFLQGSSRFVVDCELEAKLLLSVAPGGYLKCIQ